MLHKSNKLMNNYLKQNTIQQTGEQLNQQIFNKRLSTDQILEGDNLSFSMKKQSFHQRAETQLKNPNNAGLLPFAQHYDQVKDSETIGGGSIQGLGSASNSFLVIGQHNNSLSNVISSHVSNTQGMKYNNGKNQKSSTSRLINSNSSTTNKFQNNYSLGGPVQNSADRIPIQQRSDHILGVDSSTQHIHSVNLNDLNYGGQKLSNSSKQLIKNQSISGKLNTLVNPQYPY